MYSNLQAKDVSTTKVACTTYFQHGIIKIVDRKCILGHYESQETKWQARKDKKMKDKRSSKVVSHNIDDETLYYYLDQNENVIEKEFKMNDVFGRAITQRQWLKGKTAANTQVIGKKRKYDESRTVAFKKKQRMQIKVSIKQQW